MISNIVLIGMPGSGKSTVGVILAKILAKEFVDTDILIQNRQGSTLQDIINKSGHMELRKIEEEVLLDISLENFVIATGGSAAYSQSAMVHLKKTGVIVFLHADLDTLSARIHNYENRGLAKRDDQSFQDLFEERFSLYTKYSDITINSNGTTQEMVCSEIIDKLKSNYRKHFE